MARTYANVDAGIWDDAEFCALSAGAQRTYFMLITQSEISAAGTLALTLRRWARTCGEKYLEVWLAELSDARFVLIDEDTEELLVRTFAKWDGGYKHAKRRMAVVAYARAIRSLQLRTAAAEELAKLGVSTANPMPFESEPDPNPEATGFGRSVVNESGYDLEPHSTSQEREPPPSIEDVEPSPFCSRHPTGTDKPCGPCGTAKLRHQRWEKREQRRQVERRREAEQRRSAAVLAENAEAKAQAVPRPKAVPA